MLGGVAAAGVVALAGDGSRHRRCTLTLMLVGGRGGRGDVGGHRRRPARGLGINEAVTTLLLNYLAIDLMLYLIYDAWKDPPAPASPPAPRCRWTPGCRSSAHPGAHGLRDRRGGHRSWCGRCCATRPGASASGWSAATPRRPAVPATGSARLMLGAMLVGGALAGHRWLHPARRRRVQAATRLPAASTATSPSSRAGSPATTRCAWRSPRPCWRRSPSPATACRSTRACRPRR